jgi:hypothetical protein
LTANAQLVVRRDLPFPTLSNADYVSSNSAKADEVIVVQTDSSPVPLSPGRWYLGVVNADVVVAAGALVATEVSLATNTISLLDCQILTDSLCLTWSSSPGAHYFVEGKSNLSAGAWSAVSPPLVATNPQTTWCLPSPSEFGWLQIREEPTAVTNTASFTSIVFGAEGVSLEWTAAPGSEFQVQWTDSLTVPAWTTLPDVITSATETFRFLDDGSQTGGLSSPRFYRLAWVR